MRPNAFSLLAILGIAVSSAYAQSGDPSDQFLNAYLAFQKGEKAEASGNAKGALAAYNQTINLLDQVQARWPNWNPPIIKHRRTKAAEAVARLQNKVTTDRNPPAFSEPPLPSDPENILPPDSFPVPTAPPRTTRRAEDGGDPIKAIQNRLEDLQKDLSSTKERLEKVTQEKQELASKYEQAVKDAKETTEKMAVVQKRAHRAESALMDAEKTGTKSTTELDALRKDVAAAKKALRQIQIERDAEAELNSQFADILRSTQTKAKQLGTERDAAKKESAEVPKRIAEMQKEIDKVVREKGSLETKLSDVQKQLTAVSTERDDALTQLQKMKEAAKNVDKLLAENTQLMAKLQDAEKQIASFKAVGLEKDKQIAALTKDLTTTRTELADARKQSADYQSQMGELRSQLDLQAKELTKVKADATAGVAERKKLMEENDLLRGIVLRQQKEQARRDRVKKLVLEELAKLEVNSKAIIEQVSLLGSPIVKLSEREKRLFKEPQLSISDTEITFGAPGEGVPVTSADPAPSPALTPAAEPAPPTPAAPPTVAEAEPPAIEPAPTPTVTTEPPKVAEIPSEAIKPAVEKRQESAPAEVPTEQASLTLAQEPPADIPLPDALPDITGGKGERKTELANAKPPISIPPVEPEKKSNPPEGELPSKDAVDQGLGLTGPGVKTGLQPAVPPDLVGLARDAKEQFERGNYRDAEKIYEKALAKAPNNLYVLSNLGVVRFRQQKYKTALESFNKAIAIAPEDDFSHCTKGIVHYQMGEFDNAIQALTRALAINPKNPTAHNYLGITASQKGWQEAAQKELETAVTLDPNYADAHFNLAVVFATQSPPNKEDARKHYKRATELGAEPDTALEQLIK